MFELGLKAFPATVLGGFDSVLGSGVERSDHRRLENLAGGYLSSSG
jgi:branched-chain amino acid transport system permease protein